ncbi:hypothetical protein AMAG_13889 [Allomyces macrogynus ATCC 38327]|uniref:UBA domain-containing protein n=1 Tax=Allomyces macrogynus (strain ATCC 38327) TaxID=578462 RepID=A0A0L0T2Y7_ALLM3|nr:hypothetical protein AMAG_13889 [Allomyces macrogynus ATCC 38327]|eukprot:KNE69015.1 hypothetical protein AMAG_13889 [Allomyces macrogynus ATCC 38327]
MAAHNYAFPVPISIAVNPAAILPKRYMIPQELFVVRDLEPLEVDTQYEVALVAKYAQREQDLEQERRAHADRVQRVLEARRNAEAALTGSSGMIQPSAVSPFADPSDSPAGAGRPTPPTVPFDFSEFETALPPPDPWDAAATSNGTANGNDDWHQLQHVMSSASMSSLPNAAAAAAIPPPPMPAPGPPNPYQQQPFSYTMPTPQPMSGARPLPPIPPSQQQPYMGSPSMPYAVPSAIQGPPVPPRPSMRASYDGGSPYGSGPRVAPSPLAQPVQYSGSSAGSPPNRRPNKPPPPPPGQSKPVPRYVGPEFRAVFDKMMDMGFAQEGVEIAIALFRDNIKKITDFCLLYPDLADSGCTRNDLLVAGQTVDAARHNWDVYSRYLQSFARLREMGFPADNVATALLVHGFNENRALQALGV